MAKNLPLRFATAAVHAGQEPEPLTGAVSMPIFATSTYVQDGLGKPRQGYEYARVSNPTRDRLEQSLATLEGGMAARVFSSGMAAIHAVCQLLRAGDHVVCGHNVYGGTPRLFNQVMTGFGLEFSYIDTSDPAAVHRAIRGNTRMVFVETPTNPLMSITDIAQTAEICHRRRNVDLVVDNTFMSPCLQQPLRFGADMVVHSTTKFLNGHSDGLGGAVICSRRDQAERLAFLQKAAGAILSPFECFLILRGIRTLAVRIRQHDENGRAVAAFLAGHRKLKQVYYPGLLTHPQHELAGRQMSGFGSMIAIETGSLSNARRFLRRLKLCLLAESLGGVETLVSHPATMTHAALGPEGRRAAGITDGLVRLSIGIEDAQDLVADLDQALSAL